MAIAALKRYDPLLDCHASLEATPPWQCASLGKPRGQHKGTGLLQLSESKLYHARLLR